MKKNILLFSVPLTIFIVFLILSINKKNEIESKKIDIKKIQDKQNLVSNKLEIEKLFSNDLELAQNELKEWTNRGAIQSKFWSEFINKDSNIALTHTPKSSSSVNTEINKLLSYLRRTFEARHVKFDNSLQSNSSVLYQEKEDERKYGYGFTAYDGFWPSFDKNEANTILIQAKIIKEMCEFLLASFDLSESFTLISLRREAAGSEDSKHIGENIYVNNGGTILLRDNELVSSYAFEVSFTGKSKNCRSFINQLRPPYCLRSLKVSRQDNEDATNRMNSFDKDSSDRDSSILPIIRDITSKFTIDIEYLFEVDSSLDERVTRKLATDSHPEKVKGILKLFK